MTEEEKRRRLQAYALQNFSGNLQVKDVPKAPELKVAAPQPQQPLRQAATPQFKVRVDTPYDPGNFAANQPKPQTGIGQLLSKPIQPVVRSIIGTNQQGDTRSGMSKVWDQLNPIDSGRSFRQNTPTTKDNALKQYAKVTFGPIAGVQLRGARTVGGAVEGASGVVDWVTPGKGTNRFTQGVSKFNANLDKTAKGVGGGGTYAATAVPSEVASFFVPGGALTRGSTYIPKAQKAIKAVDTALTKFGSKGGKIGKAVTGSLKPTEAFTEAAITSKYIGEDVSKGREITPQRVLTDIATGVGGDSIVRIVNAFRRLKIKDINGVAQEKNAGKIEEAIVRDAPEIPADKAKDISIKLAEADTPEKVTDVLAAAKADLAAPPTVPEPNYKAPEIVTNLTTVKDPTQTKSVVSTLFPKLDVPSVEDISNKLARTTTDAETAKVLDEAKLRSDELAQTVESVTPPKVEEPTLTQQVETAPVNPTPVPEQPVVSQTVDGVEQATSPQAVQNADNIQKIDDNIAAIDEKQKQWAKGTDSWNELERVKQELLIERQKLQPAELPSGSGTVPPTQPIDNSPEAIAARNVETTDKYKKSTISKIKDWFSRNWDPRTETRSMDKQLEKILGRKLTKSESVEAAAMRSQGSGSAAVQFIQDSPLSKIIEKYGSGTDGERDFISYLQFQRDLEIRNDGGQPLTYASTEDLVKNINDLEAKYPGIREDGLSVTQGYVRPLQEMSATGTDAFVSIDELNRVRTKKDGTEYQWYTPVDRVTPEGVLKPEISSNNIGSLAQQGVLQTREATGDFAQDFDALLRLSNVVHRQKGQAGLANAVKFATEQGVSGTKFIKTAEQDAAIKQARQTVKDLVEIQKSLSQQIGKIKMKAGYAKKDFVQANKQAVSRARQLIKESIPNDGSQESTDLLAAVNDMSDKDLTDILKVFAEPDIKKTPNVQRIYNRLVKSNANYSALIDDLRFKKMDAEAIDNAKNGVRQEISELSTDPTTGLQIIKGLDANGNQFVIETTPELSRYLKGLDGSQWDGFIKAGRAAQAPFRQAFTGLVGNPAFQAKQAIWNSLMVPIASPRGYKIYAPSAIKAGLSAFSNGSDFQRALTSYNVNRYASDFHKLASDNTAAALASNKNLISKLRWFNPLTPKGFKRSWQAVNEAGGKIDQMYRSMAAKAEYDYVFKQTGSHDEAMKAAAYAHDTVLPDFGNVSTLLKAADAVVPYTAASQAGTRTFLRAIKEQPVKNAAILALYASPAVGLLAYNYSHEKGKEFYEDMSTNDKQYVLDTNVIWVSPGAYKDEKTGEWHGVVKIPVPPEFRPTTKAIRETFTSMANDSGVPIYTYARAMFDTATGGSLVSAKSPLWNMATGVATGKDPQYGNNITDPNAGFKESLGQKLEWASKQFGTIGKAGLSMTKSGEDFKDGEPTNPAKVYLDSFKSLVYGGKGSTDGSKYFRYREQAIKESGLNKNQLDTFNGVIAPTKEDLSGENIQSKSFWNTSAKANAWLNDLQDGNGALWKASKTISDKQKADGKTTDPLYDLEGDQLITVLGLMANPSPGNKEEKAIQQLQPWVKDFYEKRGDYFDKIFGEEPGKDYNGTTIPKADKQLQAKIDSLEAMPKADKYQFTKDNPDITDYFAAQDAYQRYKRDVMGLPQFDSYPKASPEVQSMMDEYNNLPKGNGPVGKTTGKPTSPDRSAWIKANPDKWAAMNEQYFKQNIYSLQGEAALAVYEGINISEDGLSDIDKIAKYVQDQKDGGGSSSYGGYSKFGYSKSGKSGKTSSGAETADSVRLYLNQLLSGVPTDLGKTPNIDITPTKVKFKVKTPSGKGRNFRKIKLN